MTSSFDRHTVIVLGGDPPNAGVLQHLRPPFAVICADSGLDHALALGLRPDVVIGDFDSVSDSALEDARRSGTIVVSFPPDKDRTDAELALHDALDRGASEITVLWGGGDRIDHILGVFAALAHPRLSTARSLTVWMDRDHLLVLHPGADVTLDHPTGTLVSLLPLGSGDVRVDTSGLQWDLADEVLHGHAARGVSNMVHRVPSRIRVTDGVLALISPDTISSRTRSTT